MTRARVAIVHPWFPAYRKAFFESLVEAAARIDVEVVIFHGSAPPEWRQRGDSAQAPYAVELSTTYFPLGRKNLGYKSLKEFRRKGPYDLVILEQAVRNLETYLLLLSSYRPRLAFWGHGKSYTFAPSRAQEALKMWLTRRGTWFFAYTNGGARAVEAAGFAPSRTSVVQNSVDTEGIKRSIRDLTSEEIDNFTATHDLNGRVGLYIGGLDHAKRIPFLLEAAKIANERDEDFKLIIIGDGTDRDLVSKAALSNPWITYLGHATGKTKALALACADVIAMPGRVGLVAVDSFAAGVPIVTTDWAYHAPEFEYLEDGHTAVIAKDTPTGYAMSLVALLADRDKLWRLSRNCIEASNRYSVTEMSRRFLDGVQRYLDER